MGPEAALALQLTVALIFAAITASVAVSKGRSGVGWFFIGFFTGCIGLIIILCFSDLKEEKARWASQQMEQRRLREQLKQERMKSEAFQGHVQARLDIHDQALDMNTRQVEGAPSASAPQIEAPAGEDLLDSLDPSPLEALKWQVKSGERTSELLSMARLRHNYRAGRINEKTLVRSSAMKDWKTIFEVPGLLELLL